MMPVPTYGSAGGRLPAAAEDLTQVPKPEVLGEIKSRPWPSMGDVHTDPETQQRIQIESGPPPWELLGDKGGTDARTFVDVPKDWVLRWINPRLLDQDGWRGWMHVRPTDPRVKVKVPSMVSPEGYVRRGGQGGDILGYMPLHWVEKRREERMQKARERADSSVARMEQLKEEFKRNSFHGVTLESAQHPSHTALDNRSIASERD